MEKYELEYVAETDNKKPDDGDEFYYVSLSEWYQRFSKWLSARLEKAEEEKTSQVVHPLGMNCKPNTAVTYCYQCGKHVRNQEYCSSCGRKLIWSNIYAETEKLYNK
jgi:hypothetical protein